MRNYFCGWYFRCLSERQTLAVIPSLHKAGESRSCTIQLITDDRVFHTQFPFSAFQKNGSQMKIAENRFGKEGFSLDIQAPDFQAAGSVRFGAFTPVRYDIMGPFRFVPFLQCRHSVYSMHHTVDGALSVNGTSYVFQDAAGYMEGDRGCSFPREYVWTQCSFPEGALMLSVADIPFGGFHFTGVIGVVLLGGKEYRLATYLGAKAVKITNQEITVRQGKACLSVNPHGPSGQPLQAPAGGAMGRIIHEHPSCEVSYRFEYGGIPLLKLDASNAAFEYEY